MVVWKYYVHLMRNVVGMPKGAIIRSVQVDQNLDPVLWAEVNTDAEREYRTFVSIGTGDNVPNNVIAYIGTVQRGLTVLHIYEVKE